MGFKTSRRNMIARQGRPMTLKRLTGSLANGGTITTASLPIQGFLSLYAPQEIIGDVRSGDARLAFTNDEIAAAAWTAPKARDQVLIDGATWVIQQSHAIYSGSTVIGHDAWIRGGVG